MKDLTKITTPFGLLDKETQDALREYHASGGVVEWYSNFAGWELMACSKDANLGFDSPAYVYRALAKPRHLELRVSRFPFFDLPLETPIGTYTHADGHTIDVVSS